MARPDLSRLETAGPGVYRACVRKSADILAVTLVCLAALVLVAAPSHALWHCMAGVVHQLTHHGADTQTCHADGEGHSHATAGLGGQGSGDDESPDDGGHPHPCCGKVTSATLARTAGSAVPEGVALGPVLPQVLWVVVDPAPRPRWGLRSSPPGVPGYGAALRSVVMLT